MSLLQTIQRGPGDVFGRVTTRCFNRTGATLKKGQVAMVDILDSETEVTNDIPGDDASVFANLTAVTQATLEAGYPIYVALEEVADNASGNFGVWGFFEVAVCDDDVSTTDVDKGDQLSMLVSESAVAVQAWATGANSGNRILGFAREDAAADSTVTARTVDTSSHLRNCYWTGGMPVLGAGDT